MKKFLTSSRPKQVLKNFIIFVPYFFTIEKWILLSPEKNLLLLSNMMLTFLSFTAISIIGYQINDFMDKEYDKNHPLKKNRPIVSKKISITEMILFIFAVISVICFIPGIIVRRYNELKQIKKKEENQAVAIKILYPKSKD